MEFSSEALNQCKISDLPIDQVFMCRFIEQQKDKLCPDLYWQIETPKKKGVGSIGPAFSFRFETEEDRKKFAKEIVPTLSKYLFDKDGLRAVVNYDIAYVLQGKGKGRGTQTHQWILSQNLIKGWVQDMHSHDWFKRLKEFHSVWQTKRVLSFLKLTTFSKIPFNGSLTCALMSLWDPVLNCFYPLPGSYESYLGGHRFPYWAVAV